MCFFYTPSHTHAFLCCGSSRNWGTYISKCLFTKMVGSRVDLWGCEISVWWQPRRWVVFLHWLKFPSLFMVCKNPIGTCSRAQSDLPYWKHSLLVCSWSGSYRILFQSPERLTILKALTLGMLRGQQARQQLLCILFCPVVELKTCCNLSGAALWVPLSDPVYV